VKIDIVNPSDGKIGLSSLRITFLDEKSKGKQRAKKHQKILEILVEGFKDQNHFHRFFVVLRNLK